MRNYWIIDEGNFDLKIVQLFFFEDKNNPVERKKILLYIIQNIDYFLYYVKNVNNQEYYFQVAHFGLAKIFSDITADITHISTRVMGNFG